MVQWLISQLPLSLTFSGHGLRCRLFRRILSLPAQHFSLYNLNEIGIKPLGIWVYATIPRLVHTAWRICLESSVSQESCAFMWRPLTSASCSHIFQDPSCCPPCSLSSRHLPPPCGLAKARLGCKAMSGPGSAEPMARQGRCVGTLETRTAVLLLG